MNGVSPATDEARLMALIEATEQRQAAINDGLFTEAERRRALIPILEQQYEWTEMLLDVKFGGQARIDPTRADVTEAELAQYKERNALEAKLAALRRARMQQVDTPLTALNRELLDTTGLLQQSLAGGVNNAIASLGSNIWGAVKGTNSFGDAWRGVGNIVGQVLTDIMVKLMIVRPLLSAFGIGDAAPVGVITPGTPTVTGAGGGTFLTHGPTHLTVGDNPGGVELVQVTPLSGIGESTINGMALRMAGGGAALTAPGATRGGGDTFHFSYQFSGGVSREEILGLLPAIVESSKAGVLEAQRRRRGGHR
ncbi:MAG: hypothetical protein FJ399_18155 [Verrucomicrobia bacterium]|nr:hypothetical protein [Verrucomicrobiota bacterium]